MDKRDKIYLNKLSFYGYHGLFGEEKKLGQIFETDIILFVDLSKVGKTGAMEDSVHYGEAFEVVKEIMEGESIDLIEDVAHRVSKALLDQFSLIEEVMVRINKPTPPIPGHYESVSVEIFRDRTDFK